MWPSLRSKQQEVTQVPCNGQSFPVVALHAASRVGWPEIGKKLGSLGLKCCLTSSATDVCALPRSQGWEMSLSHPLESLGHPVGGLGLTPAWTSSG